MQPKSTNGTQRTSQTFNTMVFFFLKHHFQLWRALIEHSTVMNVKLPEKIARLKRDARNGMDDDLFV